VPAWLPWIAIAAIGAGTVLSYAILSEMFPKSASGRANGALNLLHVTAAFAVQYTIGLVIQLWPADAAHYPEEAYRTAFGLNLALQAVAFGWFIRPQRKAALHHLPAHPIHSLASSLGLAPVTALSYAHARHSWSLQLVRARAQREAWRTTAFASFAVSALLALSVASTALGTSVGGSVIESAHAAQTRDLADGHSKQSAMLNTEVLLAWLSLRNPYGLMQQGNKGDDKQQR
jgi:MFS family permease